MPKGIKGFQKGNTAAAGRGRPQSIKVCMREQFGRVGIQKFNQSMYDKAIQDGNPAAINYLKPLSERPAYQPNMRQVDTHKDVDMALNDLIDWCKEPETALSVEEIDVVIKILTKKSDSIEKRIQQDLRDEMRQEGIKDE